MARVRNNYAAEIEAIFGGYNDRKSQQALAETIRANKRQEHLALEKIALTGTVNQESNRLKAGTELRNEKQVLTHKDSLYDENQDDAYLFGKMASEDNALLEKDMLRYKDRLYDSNQTVESIHLWRKR